MAVVISSVEKGSCAEKAGILPGESLVSVNGNLIKDVLDYRFYMTDKKLVIELSKDGASRKVTVEKPEYEDLGLDFENYLMDKEHCCKNKCIFCFIDQMPPNMRETLYFKDDDSRLGFLFGNYVTLTNLEEEDIDRIIKMRLSPINVSVHTMNPKLRVEMMKNPHAADSLGYLKKMAAAGITLHLQFVLCPGINDGEELRYSYEQVLEQLGETAESAVCVPVGLTKCRAGLPKLTPFDKESSLEVIKIVDEFRAKAVEKFGEPIFYAADEFFIKAQLPFPDYDYYGEFTQLEDGVGLCALLKHDFYEAFDYFPEGEYNRHVTIPTGKAAYATIKELAVAAESRYKGLKVDVLPMENYFFGELITVTGLLTGGDIAKQLKGRENGDAVLICESTLRYEKDKFIDDTTPEYVEHELETPVFMVPNDGYKLLAAMLGEDADDECDVIYEKYTD